MLLIKKTKNGKAQKVKKNFEWNDSFFMKVKEMKLQETYKRNDLKLDVMCEKLS